jgi:DMSO/TMAO reductase YedYZ heme-binding membrane subunit
MAAPAHQRLRVAPVDGLAHDPADIDSSAGAAVYWHAAISHFRDSAGAAALYLLVLVFVTSLLRARMGRPLWRKLHYLVFPAAVLLFLHSILTDPELKDGHPDLLDGGKVFLEIAALVCLLAIALRLRLRGNGLRGAAVHSTAPARQNSLEG